jgi:hypothetical protein
MTVSVNALSVSLFFPLKEVSGPASRKLGGIFFVCRRDVLTLRLLFKLAIFCDVMIKKLISCKIQQGNRFTHHLSGSFQFR